jgi:hypothetical protein
VAKHVTDNKFEYKKEVRSLHRMGSSEQQHLYFALILNYVVSYKGMYLASESWLESIKDTSVLDRFISYAVDET